MKKNPVGLLLIIFFLVACQQKQKEVFNLERNLDYCVQQAAKTIESIPEDSLIPRNVLNNEEEWNYVKYQDWTSGFWPGILWYIYEYTGDPQWMQRADRFSRYLTPLSVSSANDHDLGFQVFNSFGNGYRLSSNQEYKKIILKTADTLATLYNPNVGTILSWPRPVPNMEWPQHNTIMDNMLNLELLFWASKNGGDGSLYDMAVSHAEVTMENQFRPDFTSYHVVVYDTLTGDKIKAVTHQGYNDESMWARGQAWAIYGYTMVYRETNDLKFLDFAQNITDVYLDRLPDDMIPYWDFDAPNIPEEPRDASAAAIVASALFELSQYVEDQQKAFKYRSSAEAMLQALSTPKYQSKEANAAFLRHSTGHYPNGSEVDASIIYADYYYLEALLRMRNLENGEPVMTSILSK